MAIQELGIRTPYLLRLAKEASSITAFKDTLSSSDVDHNFLGVSFAFAVGVREFILPASTIFIRENISDDDRPSRNLMLLIASFVADLATNALIAVAGWGSTINVAARRIVLNYATHIGIDFIQHLFGPKITLPKLPRELPPTGERRKYTKRIIQVLYNKSSKMYKL